MRYIRTLLAAIPAFVFIPQQTRSQEKPKIIYISSGITLKAGASINSVSVHANSTNIAPGGTKFESSVSPVIAVGYLSDIGEKAGKLYFYPQIKFSSFKNSGSQDVLLSDGSVYQHVTTTEKVSALINTILGFGFSVVNAKDFCLLFSGGPALSLLAGNKQSQVKKDARTGAITTSEEKGRGVSFNFSAELTAVVKNKFLIWISSGSPITTTSFTQYSPRVMSVQAGIGYKL